MYIQNVLKSGQRILRCALGLGGRAARYRVESSRVESSRVQSKISKAGCIFNDVCLYVQIDRSRNFRRIKLTTWQCYFALLCLLCMLLHCLCINNRYINNYAPQNRINDTKFFIIALDMIILNPLTSRHDVDMLYSLAC